MRKQKPAFLVATSFLLLLVLHSATQAAPRPSESFVAVDTAPDFDRVRDYDLLHTVLDLSFDWDQRAVEGTVTHRLAPLRAGLLELHFDQHRLEFKRILVDGQEVEWRTDGDTLTVYPGSPLTQGREVEVAIDYRAVKPAEGLYWVIPDRDYPDRPYQIWTQGEMEENHFWFPCYDNPNERMTSEQIITVESKYTVIGNGEIVEKRDNGDGTTTWHYRMDTPHVPYLTSLVIGVYEVYESEWDGIPILSYVRPDAVDLAQRSFGETAEMMRIYSESIGIRYPYPAYRQVEVENFLWGGMENIGATTLTWRTLHDEDAHEVQRSEGLVSHEIAHQWWGDLVTTKNWANIWLNEGFATYFEVVYWNQAVGPDRGAWNLYADLRSYLRSDSGYRRPMVTRYYEDSNDMFDGVAYAKGGQILHMLRQQLGDDLFWKAINLYGERHRADVAETAGFREAVADVSGMPMDLFFDQWVHRGGHPEFSVSWEFISDSNLVHLTLKQTQTTDDLTPLFDVEADVDLTGDGWSKNFSVTCDATEQHFYFEVPERPLMKEFDRDEKLIKELKESKPSKEFEYQLRNSPSVISRCRAASALGQEGNETSVPALGDALFDADEFWGARGEAAMALGALDVPEARAVLLEALDISIGRIRIKVVEALRHYDDEEVLKRLREVTLKDRVPQVAAMAATSTAFTKTEGAEKILINALKRDSWRDEVRRAALRGFRQQKEEERIPLVTDYIRPGVYIETRQDAIGTLGILGAALDDDNPERRKIRLHLEDLLEDPLTQIRRSAVRALGSLGEHEAIPALRKVIRSDEHRWIKSAATEAIEGIHTGEGRKRALGDFEQDIDRLQRSNEEIKRNLKQLQKRLNPEKEEASSTNEEGR